VEGDDDDEEGVGDEDEVKDEDELEALRRAERDSMASRQGKARAGFDEADAGDGEADDDDDDEKRDAENGDEVVEEEEDETEDEMEDEIGESDEAEAEVRRAKAGRDGDRSGRWAANRSACLDLIFPAAKKSAAILA
jgi:hypothetical protein